jgi:hypothetical protein
MEGLRLLLLERIDPVSLKGKGDFVVGIDGVGANAGEIVFYVTGSSARMTETTKGKPRMPPSSQSWMRSKKMAHSPTKIGGAGMTLARIRGTIVADSDPTELPIPVSFSSKTAINAEKVGANFLSPWIS